MRFSRFEGFFRHSPEQVSLPPEREGDGGEMATESPIRETPKEAELRSREYVSKRVLRGATRAQFVELKDDGSGIFKQEGYKHERAAYLVDRFLDFGLVPPTVIRQEVGREGSVQEFVANAKMAWEAEEAGEFDEQREQHREQLKKLWIFDLIIGNWDRSDRNFLIRQERIYAIDHHFAFEDLAGFKGYPEEFIPEDVVEKIRRFLQWQQGQEALQELLAELIGSAKAKKCLQRIAYVGASLEASSTLTKENVRELDKGKDLGYLWR